VHSIAGSAVSNRFGDNQVTLVLNGKIQDVRYRTDRSRSATMNAQAGPLSSFALRSPLDAL
jgi:hypothetical protein